MILLTCKTLRETRLRIKAVRDITLTLTLTGGGPVVKTQTGPRTSLLANANWSADQLVGKTQTGPRTRVGLLGYCPESRRKFECRRLHGTGKFAQCAYVHFDDNP